MDKSQVADPLPQDRARQEFLVPVRRPGMPLADPQRNVRRADARAKDDRLEQDLLVLLERLQVRGVNEPIELLEQELVVETALLTVRMLEAEEVLELGVVIAGRDLEELIGSVRPVRGSARRT